MSDEKVAARRAWRSAKGLVYAGIALVVIALVVVLSGRGHPAHHPDSDAHVSSVKLGMIESQVRQILGEPNSTQHSETDGIRHDTWRYTTLETASDYRFVFKNGRLTAIDRT